MAALITVPAGAAAVVTRLGRYRCTLPPGRHLLAPGLDRVQALVPTEPQELPARFVVATRDDRSVAVECTLRVTVTDARAAVFEVADYRQALNQLASTVARTIVAELDFVDALTACGELGSAIDATLNEVAPRWGLRIEQVQLTRIAAANAAD